MTSPTQRSLKYLRDQGFEVGIVERYNAASQTRHDLFGFIDLVCLDGETTIGIQVTSASNMSARVKKIVECPALPAVRKAGWKIVVQGWRKNSKGRWILREVDVS